MNYVLSAQGEGVHVRFRERLDALRDDACAWSGFMSELLLALAQAPRRAVFVDLRFVDLVDSRSVFQLQTGLATMSPPAAIYYLGPGPGYSRLCALGEASALAPMLEFPPWENAIAKQSPPDSLDSSKSESKIAPVAETTSIVESKTAPPVAPKMQSTARLQERTRKRENNMPPTLAMATRRGAPATLASASTDSILRATREVTLEDILALPAVVAEPSLQPIDNRTCTPAAAESTQFCIDIDYEQWLIEQGSDARDSEISIAPLEFNEHWIAPKAVCSVSLGDSGDAAPLEATDVRQRELQDLRTQAPPVFITSTVETTRAPSPSMAGFITARLKAISRAGATAAQPGASMEREAAGTAGHMITAESHSPPKAEIESSDTNTTATSRDSSDDLLHGVGNLLKEVGRLERARASLAAELEQQAKIHRKQRAEIETLRHNPVDVSLARSSPEAERRSVLFGRTQESLAGIQTLATRWQNLVSSFRQRGILSADEFERLIHELGAIGAAWAGFAARAIEGAGERARGEYWAEWRGVALALATRVREDSSVEACTALARTLTLATLYAPLRDAEPAAGRLDVCGQLRELFKSGAFLRPREAPDSACESCASDVALWQAARLVTEALRGSMNDWNRALRLVISRLDALDAARSGIARIADAHSHYYLGSWVELSTGELGPVVETVGGRPDRPRVLVLFRRHGGQLATAHARQFPADGLEIATIERVVADPCLCDAGATACAAATDAALKDAAACART